MFCPDSMHKLPLVISVIYMVHCDLNYRIIYKVFLDLEEPPCFHFTVNKVFIEYRQT